jgi:hypothetical protein
MSNKKNQPKNCSECKSCKMGICKNKRGAYGERVSPNDWCAAGKKK